MAPRRRGKARKDSRMDAALDAMRPLGYSEKFVREMVKELLKEELYGEDGWFFIENDSYKVLLDHIFQKEEDSLRDDSRCGDNITIPTAGPSSSRGVILASCSNPLATCTTTQTNEALDSMSQTSEVLDTLSLTNDLDGRERPPLAEGEERGRKDVNLGPSSGEEQVDNVTRNNDKDSGGSELLGNTLISCLPDIHSPQPADSLPTQRRRPCYGWISSDNEQDVVRLTPAPFQEIAKFFIRVDVQRKRKTRWDVRPEDM